ncbi:MAG: prepilin-type N-terminal cleavage/methylation domain-containing protein [Gammaproteobacteria bacterium]|jgi:prepilin-type N-terminal cleavage/methylation domain-containing protein
MKLNKQSGFTLVEIAIVLVVIGLLLGGILKGQQLINSARVRNLADQNSGIQAAYYGFIDRYRNLPGDMDPTQACAAIGDGIDANGACATPANAPGGGVAPFGANGLIDTTEEAGSVWAHLSGAGFLNGTFSGQLAGAQTLLTDVTYNTGVPIGAVPANAFQGPILLGHLLDYVDGNAIATVTRLAFSFGGNVPVPLLRDLDQKLDDGVAGRGVVRSAFGIATSTTEFGPIVTYQPGTEDCLNTTPDPYIWDVNSSNQTCNAIYLY